MTLRIELLRPNVMKSFSSTQQFQATQRVMKKSNLHNSCSIEHELHTGGDAKRHGQF